MARTNAIHGPTVAIGVASIALILALRWLKHRLRVRLLPEVLIVVVLMAAVVAQFGLVDRGVAVVGDIPAARIVNLHDLRYHVRASRFDLVIVATTAVSAFAISVEFCVLIGVFMSFLLAVPRTGRMLLTEFVVTAEGTARERRPDDVGCDRILIFGLEGEMYFGSGGSLEQHLDTIEARVRPETQAVLLRLKRARNADAVGLSLLEKFVARLQARGVHVILCGVQEAMLTRMRNRGFGEKLDASHVFPEQPIKQTSTAMAIRFAYDLLTDFCPTCPRRRGGFEALHYDI